MCSGYLDVVRFACKLHKTIWPLRQRLGQADVIDASSEGETGEYKCFMQELQLRAAEPIW